MLHRYKSEQNRDLAEAIYKLRQQGVSFIDIASEMEMKYTNVLNIYKRECQFRKQAFHTPFIEYISPRIENALKKKLDLELLSDPQKLAQADIIRTLYLFPGVGEKALNDLADALSEAGYESFDLDALKESMFKKKKALSSAPRI